MWVCWTPWCGYVEHRDVGMLNTVKNEPADVSSVSPSSEQMLLRIAFTDCSDEG